MKKYTISTLSALAAIAIFHGVPAQADNMASIGITPATGVVTLAPNWSIGPDLGGFHQMSQDLGLGGQANDFYSLKNTTIPLGGDISAFTLYVPASGFPTDHHDIGSKLTPDSYSALTSADPDVGYGSVNMYFIHHKGTTDYFTVLRPGTSVSSSVTDLKPMSGPGGPATVTNVSGYFGLTFAASNLGYGLNQFYYLRTDAVTGFTKFGTLDPALLNTSADQFDLGMGGHKALAFTGQDVGYGTDKMYYLRLDPVTGFTILGMLDPALAGVRHTSDIANLGSVFSTLTFTTSDLGFGINQFYTTGSINPTWQSVSFAAIADRAMSAGSFTVNPTASSALPIVLTVVTGSATISAPVGGVFTVTPTAPGLITLQATQAGQVAGPAYEPNMLRQSFTVSGGVATVSNLIGVEDFDGDGRAEPLWHSSSSREVRTWLIAGGSLGFGTESGGWTIIGVGDFDGDGRGEPLWHSASTGEVRTWLAAGSSLGLGTESGGWTVINTGDFDGDGRTEPLWRNALTGEIRTWFAAGGSLSFGTEASGWSIIGVGDFDGDHRAEPLWHSSSTGEVRTWLTAGGSLGFGTESGGWSVLGVGDFDGDGRAEPIWHNYTTGEVRAWPMAGGSLGFGTESGGWSVINTGDFDGNGRAEPLWRNANTGEVRTWFAAGGSLGFGSEGGGWSVIN